MHAPYQRTLRAHAKINLLLRILAREASGYHGIETIFQRLALHDVVHVSASAAARTLECDGPMMPPTGLGEPEANLAWRAAALYARESGWDTGWHIAIEKHIPVGGGLGGGSSDAAAVLRALEAMSPVPIGHDRLVEIGGTLGADVAFFVADTSLALAWARGDRMLPLAPLPHMAVRLVTFAEGVNTGAAYSQLASARAAGADSSGAIAYAPDTFASWHSVAAVAANDFEQVVSTMHPGVAATLPVVRAEAARLLSHGHPAIGMLSGSGATCFLLHPMGVESPLQLAEGVLLHTETA